VNAGSIILGVFALLGAVVADASEAHKKPVKAGLEPSDWAYELPAGVTRRETTYYSDDVPCYAMMFYPKGFVTTGKTPAVIVGQGWAGSHFSVEKYGARMAEKGLVAMVIDYRGWGWSDGFITMTDKPEKTRNDDSVRFTRKKANVVIKRTRLLPLKQVEDVRNAISYLQGEPGVDPERIGIWASSTAGGNAIVVAAQDARVKVIAMQVPSISGLRSPKGAYELRGRMLEDAILRARMGQGAEMEAGFSPRRTVDLETSQATAEYRPFRYLKHVGPRPVLFILAEHEQMFSNEDHSFAASKMLAGPTKVVVIPDISHFDMFINEPFNISANLAADWFREHLGMNLTAKMSER